MTTSSEYLYIKAAATVTPANEPQWAANIPAADKRRSPRIWQMASVAAQRLAENEPLSARSMVVATALGALDETREFLGRVYTEGLGSPRNFIASVHNSMGGKLAQQFAIAGPNLTICDGQCSTAAALAAADLLDAGDLPALIIAVDENIALLDDLLPFFSPECRQFFTPGWNDGAVALLCDRNPDAALGRIRSLGPSPMAHDDAAAAVEQMCRTLTSETEIIALSESSGDLVRPAMTVERLIRRAQPGRYAIPSCCPTAGTVAVIELCI